MNKKDIDYLNKLIEKGDKMSDKSEGWEINIHYREGLGRLIERKSMELMHDDC